jgi:hypothetical protein
MGQSIEVLTMASKYYVGYFTEKADDRNIIGSEDFFQKVP